MTKQQTKPTQLKCVKCGYEWTPRYPERTPKECPGCKSRYWQGESNRD